VGYWHRDDQLDVGRLQRDQLAIESPSCKTSDPTMGCMPIDRMWAGNQGGHQTQTSQQPHSLSQHNCGSVFEPRFTQHNLNCTSEQSKLTQVADPGSSDPRVIPGTSPPILVFPHSTANITAECHHRFREVVSMFRENTEKHQELAQFVQHIDYTLRMCGTSYETAHPSILVFCRKQEFKCLRTLLTSRELGMQYLRRKPEKTTHFLGWLKTPPPDPLITPLFDLYFWHAVRPRTLLGDHNASINFAPRLDLWRLPNMPYIYSLCGAALRPSGNVGSSTFSCVILVDTELYGLTTRHVVGPAQGIWTGRDGAVGLSSTVDESPLTSNFRKSNASVTASDGCDFFIENIEYDSVPEDEVREKTISSAAVPRSWSDDPRLENLDAGLIEVPALLLPHQEELGPSSDHDFDWALFKIGGLVSGERWSSRLVNHTRLPGRGVIRHYVKACPTIDTPVLLVTRGKEPKKGILRPGTSILGGINDSRVSPVWTVGLANGQGKQAACDEVVFAQPDKETRRTGSW